MRMIDADALKMEFPKDEDWDYPVNTNSYVCELIDAQPTIEPKRKKGHWIRIAPRYYKCSECGVRANNSFANFCHRCGSYNGGDENV